MTESNPFTREQLADKALLALREIALTHEQGAWPHTDSLRAILAFLYRGGDREPYDRFFRQATTTREGEVMAHSFGRFQAMRSAYAAIARQWGRDYW